MTLIEAIARVESNQNPCAMRFEPDLYSRYPAWAASEEALIRRLNECDADTARAIACTSWGSYQLLGVNVYAMGYNASIMRYSTMAQGVQARRFVIRCEANPDADMSKLSEIDLVQFATHWNGPGNPQAYAAALRKAAS